jgi:hypothetical protein
MSKSIGNVMDPAVVINGGPNKKKEPAYGADVIRVWAASTDYTRDVVIGPTTLAAASSTLRKVGAARAVDHRVLLARLCSIYCAVDILLTMRGPCYSYATQHGSH